MELYENLEFSRSFPILRENFKFLADDIEKFLTGSPLVTKSTVSNCI